MAPVPYTHTGARIAFYVVLFGFVALEQRVRLHSWRNRQGSREDRGSLVIVISTVLLGVGGGFLLALDWHPGAIPFARWPIFIVGLVLMCAGIGVRQWSVALLGEFFTVDVRVHPDQVVVERGPYRWVRHPSYTGMVITFVGIGVALGNWAALIALAVVPTVGLVARIRVEERALMEGIGEPYRRFAASRARLIPGVW
jgi:protein-S-isoprenylcysteine O-methyltransferase Ste14